MLIRQQRHKKRVLLFVILLLITACDEVTNERNGTSAPTISDDSVSIGTPAVNDRVSGAISSAEVCLSLPTEEPDPGMMTVNVYFACKQDSFPRALYPFPRTIPKDASIQKQLHLAIDALLAGPTETERDVGFTSVFSLITVNALNSITLNEDGTAIVDLVNLADLIPNASASAMHSEIVRPLDQTLFQFEHVRRIDYRFDGNCITFAEVFQTTPCQYRTRAEWQARQASKTQTVTNTLSHPQTPLMPPDVRSATAQPTLLSSTPVPSETIIWEGLVIPIPPQHVWNPEYRPEMVAESAVLAYGVIEFDLTYIPVPIPSELPDGKYFTLVQFKGTLQEFLAVEQRTQIDQNPINSDTIRETTIAEQPAIAYSNMVIGVSQSVNYIVKLEDEQMLLIYNSNADDVEYQATLSGITISP